MKNVTIIVVAVCTALFALACANVFVIESIKFSRGSFREVAIILVILLGLILCSFITLYYCILEAIV